MNRPSRKKQPLSQTQISEPSKLRRIKPTAIAAAIFLCGLVVSAVLTGSIAQAQTDTSQLVLEHPGWIQVPGALVRPDCVHAIPRGASVKVENGRDTGDVIMNGAVIAHYDPCSEDAAVRFSQRQTEHTAISDSTGNGFVEDSSWDDTSLSKSDDIDFLGNYLTVPTKPSKNGAVILLFNGVEDSTDHVALQPTLQYGENVLGVGGNYWVIVTYVLVGSDTYYSPAVKVSAGNKLELFSEIYEESGGDIDWLVEVINDANGDFTYQDVISSGYHYTVVASGVLQVGGVSSCSNFPASGKAVFTKTGVDHDFPSYKALSPKWTGEIFAYGGPSCDFAVGPGTTTTLDF